MRCSISPPGHAAESPTRESNKALGWNQHVRGNFAAKCRKEYNRRVKEVVEASWLDDGDDEEDDEDDS